MPTSNLAIAQLPDGEQVSHDLTLDSLADLELPAPITANVLTQRISRDSVAAEIHIVGALSLECDRCLSQYDWPFDHRFQVIFSELPEDEEEGYEIINQQIDIAEPIRQELILMTPVKRICSEDCPGIALE